MIILESGAGNYIKIGGEDYSCFAGNNYLGLAGHPLVKEAAALSARQYGVSFSASRQTTGTAAIHLELEKRLAGFRNAEDSVIYASGYLGNRILMQVLREEYSMVFADESVHASIIDGIPSGVRVFRYDHLNIPHLEALLKRAGRARPLIITDGLFPLTGEIAPLDRIIPLAGKYGATLLVDDAHATGVLGEHGRGTPEYFHLEDAYPIFRTETMSKALGVYGGFIAGSRELTGSIRRNSMAYQASTALPPIVVSAAIAALDVLENNPHIRQELLEKAGKIRKGLSALGFRTSNDPTPIIPLMFRSDLKARDLSAFLETNRYIVPFIQYPSGTAASLVRITACASHTEEQISGLIELLKKWRDKNGTE